MKIKIAKITISLISCCFLFSITTQAQTKSVTTKKDSTKQSKVVYSQNALDYRLQKRLGNAVFPENEKDSHWNHTFLSFGISPVLTERGNHSLLGEGNWGVKAFIQGGKWLTPLHGFRAGISAGFHQNTIKGETLAKTFGINADYLFNITNLGWGYNRNRFFQVIATAGLGYETNFTNGNRFSVSHLHFGLQEAFRLTPSLSFFVEPQLYFYSDNVDRIKGNTDRGFQVGYNGWMGFKYNYVSKAHRSLKYPFKSQKWNDNFFVSTSLGVNALLNHSLTAPEETVRRIGPIAKVAIGKWFNYQSGLRFSAGVGLSRVSENNKKTKYGIISTQFDYLFNLNSLFTNPEPEEKFEFWLTPGLTYQYQHHLNENKGHWGLGIGLLGNFYLSPTTDLFIEPRLSLLKDNLGINKFVNQKNALAEINIGLTYHAPKLNIKRKKADKFEEDSFLDHLFTTAYVGMQAPIISISKNQIKSIGPRIGVSVGKWFTPYSALRLSADAGFVYFKPISAKHTKLATLSLDYMLNLSNLLFNYNATPKFEVIPSAGLNLTYASSNKNHPYRMGVNLGLQGLWHISNEIGLFVEPQMRLYKDKYLPGNMRIAEIDNISSLVMGIQFKGGDYQPKKHRKSFGKTEKKVFVSLGAGFSGLVNKKYFDNDGPSFSVALSKWTSTVAGWRLGAEGMLIRRNSKARMGYGGITADYLINLPTLINGYRPDRTLNFTGFAGLNLGAAYRHGKTNLIPGISGGLEATVQFTPSLGLFIQPKVTLYGDKFDKYDSPRNLDPVFTVQAGLKFGIDSHHQLVQNLERPTPYFVEASLGASYFNCRRKGLKDDIIFNYALSLGKWFNANYGTRLFAEKMNFKEKRNISITSFGIDALMNVSNLLHITNELSKFHFVGFAGINYNLPDKNQSSQNAFGLRIGTQFMYNINPRLGIYAEPSIQLIKGKIERKDNVKDYVGGAKFMIGTQYKF
jgi:hypothetical protein